MDSKEESRKKSLDNLQLGRKRANIKRLKRQSWARLKNLKQNANKEVIHLTITQIFSYYFKLAME